jgi:hypothetical protein
MYWIIEFHVVSIPAGIIVALLLHVFERRSPTGSLGFNNAAVVRLPKSNVEDIVGTQEERKRAA